MNSRKEAYDKIKEFLLSDKKALLLTGTYQFEKHKLVMGTINKHYKNAKILFRTNGVSNAFENRNILGQFESKKHKAGEFFKIGNNYYSVDSFNNSQTRYKTDNNYNFAIVYPIDAITRGKVNLECIDDLFNYRNIDKIFLVSWTDHLDYDYKKFKDFYNEHVVFDALEEDPEYHERVLNPRY